MMECVRLGLGVELWWRLTAEWTRSFNLLEVEG